MIDFLRGKLVFTNESCIVLDVHGVGYRVFCGNPYGIAARADEETVLFIHHHVREDAIQLYGFESREEQMLFRRLLDVSGIGPRVALGILSAGRPAEVIGAIYQENVAFLMKLPGIGKKTAQRIILDLKDKLADLSEVIAPVLQDSSSTAAAAVSGASAKLSEPWQEAKEALMALGYTEAETDKIWPKIKEQIRDGMPVETLVKLGLQVLFRG